MVQSRGQSLSATFTEGRALLLAEQRARRAAGEPELTISGAARDIARIFAETGVRAAVYSPGLRPLATAGPGDGSGAAVVDGVSLPGPSQDQLLAAAQFDTVTGPELLGGGRTAQLVMVFPFTGPAGRTLGVVELAESAASVSSELRTATLVVVLGSLAVLLAALLLGLWITSRALGPLRRLTLTAAALGRGDLSQRSGLRPGSDEVGELARVFDRMAEGVEGTVREREAAERRMRQFIGDASHELRTPLTAIKGYLEVLQRGGGASPEEVRRALPVMSREAERMRLLVQDLLTLARADSGPTPELRPLELAPFLEQFLAPRVAADEVRLELQPGLVALADPQALTTIVGNLQANAERHGRGREVAWRTLAAGEMVGLECGDRGPGIAPEELAHVFERFYRAGGSRSRQEGGSGLGLAIVQSLAVAQGGRVEAESRPGEGARFRVLLRRSSAAGWVDPRS